MIYLIIFISILLPLVQVEAETEYGESLTAKIEETICCGDSLDDVVKKLKIIGFDPQIDSSPEDYDQMKRRGGLPESEDKLYEMDFYSISLEKELGIEMSFNYLKQLCHYDMSIRVDKKLMGRSVLYARSELEKSCFRKIRDKERGGGSSSDPVSSTSLPTPVTQAANRNGLATKVLESALYGDTLDVTVVKLKKLGLDPYVRYSQAHGSVGYEMLDKLSEDDVFRMDWYMIDMLDEIGMAFYFNHGKRLVRFGYSMTLGNKLIGKSLRDVRSELVESHLRDMARWSDGCAEAVRGGQPISVTPSIGGNSSDRIDRLPEKPGAGMDVEHVELPGFAFIPGGDYIMGDALDSRMKNAPTHKVNVSPFYLHKTEVTNAHWRAVREWGLKNGYSDLAEGENSVASHPILGVSWYDAVKWCNAMSEKAGFVPCYYTDAALATVYRTGEIDLANAMVKWSANGYRLPTEAEWEKAARGGLVGKRFPWGNTISHHDANFYNRGLELYQTGETNLHPDADALSLQSLAALPVGSFTANGYGLYDMSGNAPEWCWDRYGSYPATLLVTDPHGPESGRERVYRGGAWCSYEDTCRVAYRRGSTPSNVKGSDNYYFYFGLRPALDALAVKAGTDTKP